MTAEFPDKLDFLFDPHRYKVAYSGRGGAKSWGFARALLIMGAQRKLRIVCARETQKSISESVHHLLDIQVGLLELRNRYEVLESKITGTNGTEFIFVGLKHNIDNIKSLEGADIVWVEEAHTVSKESWDKLTPTVRKDGSEIWISFNPELATDVTWTRFVLNPPSNAIVVKLSWRDNPWFPPVLDIERRDMLERDPEGYRNVWEGETVDTVSGAIFGAELKAADADQRITNVPLDRTRPVHTFWDLGFGDKTAIWFAQAVDGWYQIVDYLEDSGKTIADYCIRLQQKGYMYGIDWLPHDAVDTIIHARLGADKSRSIEMLMRHAGRTPRVAPKLYITDRINATRTIFSQCRFDAQKCADGLQGLRHYQWQAPSAAGAIKREPLHNWASHPADAFCTLGVCIKQPTKAPVVSVVREESEYSWMS